MGFIWLFLVLLTVSGLAPAEPGKKGDAAKAGYKFIHCSECKMELPYNADMADKRCPKCQPPKTGYFKATQASIKSGGSGAIDPWRYVYVAVFIESVVMLGLTVKVLSAPIFDPKQAYYILPCPHCGQRLRYRGVSLGSLGSCSRCKRMLRFPEEEEAMREEDVQKLEAEVAKLMQEQALAAEEAAEEARLKAQLEAELRAEMEAEARARAEIEAQARAEFEAAEQARLAAIAKAERDAEEAGAAGVRERAARAAKKRPKQK